MLFAVTLVAPALISIFLKETGRLEILRRDPFPLPRSPPGSLEKEEERKKGASMTK